MVWGHWCWTWYYRIFLWFTTMNDFIRLFQPIVPELVPIHTAVFRTPDTCTEMNDRFIFEVIMELHKPPFFVFHCEELPVSVNTDMLPSTKVSIVLQELLGLEGVRVTIPLLSPFTLAVTTVFFLIRYSYFHILTSPTGKTQYHYHYCFE